MKGREDRGARTLQRNGIYSLPKKQGHAVRIGGEIQIHHRQLQEGEGVRRTGEGFLVMDVVARSPGPLARPRRFLAYAIS